MKPRFWTIKLISAALVMITTSAIQAISPDLETMERKLNFNREAIKYINICISNLPQSTQVGSSEKVFYEQILAEFKDGIQHDFYAQMWFLQGNYSRTYKDLYISQNHIANIFRRILVNYIDNTWVLLEEAAPLVVRTRDREARHLLRLGYRDLESSKLFFKRGYNIKPTLQSNSINYYRQGIKRVRRSRRFALLSLIEAKLPSAEKDKFKYLSLDDVRQKAAGTLYVQTSYKRILNQLINLMGRTLVPRTVSRDLPQEVSLILKPRTVRLNLLNVHQDNYNHLQVDRKSVWMGMVRELSAQKMYKKYSLPTRNSVNKDDVPRGVKEPSDKKKEPAKTPPAKTQPKAAP